MSGEKFDMNKVLEVLAQPGKKVEPLQNTKQETELVKFIRKDNTVGVRKIRLYIPENASEPMPLIYVPHYEMQEDALELRDYLAQGWAVASPTEMPADYNSILTDDDLTFNNAALFQLRCRPDFDPERIMIIGGSAGGYTTLMLTGQNLGLCASIANSPVANIYFNFYHYFQYVQALNLEKLKELQAKQQDKAVDADPGKTETSGSGDRDPEAVRREKALEFLTRLKELPVPFAAALGPEFVANTANFPDLNDYARWEDHTGVGVAARFSSPLLVTHHTSDVLVPVDQITRRFTYPEPGASLPADFNPRLPENYPGVLGRSLEEVLPVEKTEVTCIHVPEKDKEQDLPFNPDKQFNLDIFDDGPVEGYGTHSSRMDMCRRFDIPYLKAMLEKGARVHTDLTPDMLSFLLDQYSGRTQALPAHTGVDDTVYGSLRVYQRKVLMELSMWLSWHSEDELMEVFRKSPRRDEQLSVLQEVLVCVNSR